VVDRRRYAIVIAVFGVWDSFLLNLLPLNGLGAIATARIRQIHYVCFLSDVAVAGGGIRQHGVVEDGCV